MLHMRILRDGGHKKTPLIPSLGRKANPSAVPPGFAPQAARARGPGNGGRTGRVSTAAPGRTKPGVRSLACSRWPDLSWRRIAVIFPFIADNN